MVLVHETENHEHFLYVIGDSFMMSCQILAALLFVKKHGIQQSLLGSTAWLRGQTPKRLVPDFHATL